MQQWLNESSELYVRIFDPYFSANELNIVRLIPGNIRVDIITTWEAQGSFGTEDISELECHFQKAVVSLTSVDGKIIENKPAIWGDDDTKTG